MLCITVILLLVVLLSHVCITVVYDGEFAIVLSYLFWRKPLYPDEKKIRLSDYSPKRLRRRRKRQKRKRSLQKQKATIKKKSEGKGKKPLLRQLRALRLLFHILRRVYRGVLSSAHVRIDRFHMTVASEDAAKTAILYGAASQSAAYILALLRNFTHTHIKRDALFIAPDFLAEESSLSLKVRFSMPLYKLVFHGLKIGIIALLHGKKQKENNKVISNTDPTDPTENGGNNHE